MKTINLRDYYPYYLKDTYIEVADEIANELCRFTLNEEAYRINVYRAKAYYSLDCDDGIDSEAINKPLTPEELLDYELTAQLIHEAIASLPPVQARRVEAHLIWHKSKSAIAKSENIQKSSAGESIERGLKNLRNILKKFYEHPLLFAFFCTGIWEDIVPFMQLENRIYGIAGTDPA